MCAKKGLPSDVRKVCDLPRKLHQIFGLCPAGAKPPRKPDKLAGRAEPYRTSEGKPFLFRTSESKPILCAHLIRDRLLSFLVWLRLLPRGSATIMRQIS